MQLQTNRLLTHRALEAEHALFEAARLGIRVEISVGLAPEGHPGPVLPGIGDDLAAALTKQADTGRRLGQVIR